MAPISQTPQTTPAPQILKSDAQTPAQSSAAANPLQGVLQQIEQFCQTLLGIQPQICRSWRQSQSDNPLGLPQGLVHFLQNLGIGNVQLAHAPLGRLPAG